jgi:hypothetical protein
MFADIAATRPIGVLSLRYFNPIGADPKMRTGLQLPKPTHALGKMVQAQQEGTPSQATGTDYPTRDGTGIRDYIHVWDLAAAHVAALSRFALLAQPARPPSSISAQARAPPCANCSMPSTAWSARRSKRRTPHGDPATSPEPTPASTGPSSCSTGSPSTESRRVSPTPCGGPAYGTRCCPTGRPPVDAFSSPTMCPGQTSRV